MLQTAGPIVRLGLRAINGRIVHCGIINSCLSYATSEIVKRFWATVRSTIASVGLHLYLVGGVA